MSDTDVILRKLTEISDNSDKNLRSIGEKLAALDSRMDKVDLRLAVHQTELKHYVERIDQADKKLETLQEQVEPLKAHINRWAGVGKATTYLSVVIGMITAFLRFKFKGE